MLRLILLRLLESYFRHKWLYLAPVIIMIAAASVYFYTLKPKYLAQGVFFTQQESLLAKLTSVTDTSVTWQTPASFATSELNELLQTDAFIRSIISQSDLESEMSQGPDVVQETIKKVRKAVWVTSLGNNQVRISAQIEQPQVAYQLVNAAFSNYTQWKINGDRSDSEAAHNFFTDLIAQYKLNLDQANKNMQDYLLAHPDPLKGERPTEEKLQMDQLQAEITLAQTRYANALDKDENARLAAAQSESNVLQSYVLIDAPRVPDKPEISLKDIGLQSGIFLFAGLLISALGVMGAALLDRSFRFPIDVVNATGMEVIALVPVTGGLRKVRKQKQSTGESGFARIFKKHHKKEVAPVIEANSEASLEEPQGIMIEEGLFIDLEEENNGYNSDVFNLLNDVDFTSEFTDKDLDQSML